MTIRYAALLVSSLVACSTPAPRAPAVQQAPIVNGTLDQGHVNVGIVFNGGSNGGCTGTLIAPDKVLTAAHCVFGYDLPHDFEEKIYFFLGDTPRLHYAVEGVTVHPDYAHVVRESDVALLFLEQAITHVTPASLASSAPTDGAAITLVGYGITGAGLDDFGDKRQAPQTIAEVGDQWFSIDCEGGSKPCSCSGDSGGPTFVSGAGGETLVGVHSGSSQGCTGFSYDMRVDLFAPWIASASVDIKLYRAPCDDNTDCHSGLCVVSTAGQEFCSRACSTDAPCPYLDQCTNDVCLPHTGGDGALGDACDWGLDCLSGRCLILPAPLEGAACSQACDIFAQDCPNHYECRNTDDGPLCVPTGNITPPPADSGAPPQDGGPPTQDGGAGDSGSAATGDATVAGDTSGSSSPGDGGGCRVGGGGSAMGFLALLLLALWRRSLSPLQD